MVKYNMGTSHTLLVFLTSSHTHYWLCEFVSQKDFAGQQMFDLSIQMERVYLLRPVVFQAVRFYEMLATGSSVQTSAS